MMMSIIIDYLVFTKMHLDFKLGFRIIENYVIINSVS